MCIKDNWISGFVLVDMTVVPSCRVLVLKYQVVAFVISPQNHCFCVYRWSICEIMWQPVTIALYVFSLVSYSLPANDFNALFFFFSLSHVNICTCIEHWHLIKCDAESSDWMPSCAHTDVYIDLLAFFFLHEVNSVVVDLSTDNLSCVEKPHAKCAERVLAGNQKDMVVWDGRQNDTVICV